MNSSMSPARFLLGIGHVLMALLWGWIAADGLFGDNTIYCFGMPILELPRWLATPFVILTLAAAGGAVGLLRPWRFGLFLAAVHAGACLLLLLPATIMLLIEAPFLYGELALFGLLLTVPVALLGYLALSKEIRRIAAG